MCQWREASFLFSGNVGSGFLSFCLLRIVIRPLHHGVPGVTSVFYIAPIQFRHT